ncbi:MAG TPA: Stk1 family PASTA domain-containing Ser/Thr kinase [Candidatus Enterocloster excrementipullorum]|uniref:non-specific serine/threonine protein kinase n=1 Tax=Candidatus Enterocloster excrementipullorum TaxID=2838559 RepID=A0A9D2N2A6_9FIRM|nr:Stk1 family PASTA domain-containing Ser/Thr kinase [Candidatus Enterocloster excrementipullorum]
MLNPGTYLQNRYEILEKIGSGGMSVVYKAQCHTLNRLVAIKVLKEEFAFDRAFIDKFRMEAQAAARLSHPNIVSVYDVVEEGALHYIVMELIEGVTLKSYIEKRGCLENKEAIGIAIQVASGIAAAHSHHIVHRDIKPQNIIISRDGKVKVADFGIAKAVSAQTMNATAVGSVHYISPEQARGGYCDERSDIYSFGITLYEMVAGKVPFEGDNTVAVALAHLEDPVVPPTEYNPDICPGLEQIILKCTQKRPDMRYGAMEDVIADLRRVLVDPQADVLAAVQEEAEPDADSTRMLTKEEMGAIKEGRRRPAPRKKHRDAEEDDVNPQFDRIVTAIGVVAAILIVAVVIFLLSRLTGLFTPRTSENIRTTAAAETSLPAVEVTISDNQVSMPSILGMTEEEARRALSDCGLTMTVTAREYSDNYEEGQVMSQTVVEGDAVEQGTDVGVTISLGSDKVDLAALNLTQMTADQAEALLKEKNLLVQRREEPNDTVPQGNVIRYSPETAKAGENVTLYVSTGPQVVPGQVPELRGRDQVTADALLAGAGLTTGTVTYEASDTVPEGIIINQSVEPGTILPLQSTVDYVISGAETETESDESGSYYVGSIDQTCSLGDYIGPAAQSSSIRILVRLKQTVNGDDVYTTLMSPRLVVGAQDIPIVISRIRGAYGVDSGTVEVVDADDLDNVIASYPVAFFPAG